MYHKWQSYDVLLLRYQAWWTEFSVILDHFLSFYPTNNLKSQNFEKLKKTAGDILHRCNINDNYKLYGSIVQTPPFFKEKLKKKTPGDIIILQKSTKNHDYMLYCSWDMTCNKCNCFFHFVLYFAFYLPSSPKNQNLKKWKKYQEKLFFILGYFLSFYLLNNLENQNLKKWKTHLEISSFYNSVPKIKIICYTVAEIWRVTDVIIFHFRHFFLIFSFISTWRYHHFTYV